MSINSDAYFDEKCGEGELPLTEDEKTPNLHLPHAGNSISRRKLRGNRNQCAACLEYFNSCNAFDQHRTGSFNGTRRCLTVVEMQAKNFGKTKDAFWLCPVTLKDRERLNRIRTKSKKPAPITTVTAHHV
jgi:hypothetical protein